MAKCPNWLDVEHRPIENGSGDEEIPAEGRIGRLFGKSRFISKQQAFLDIVLDNYISLGVEELEMEKLTPLLKLRYHHSISDAVADLGEDIGKAFTGFQQYLYQKNAVA